MNAAPPPDPVSGGSLRLRLLAGTLAWMLLSIALAGWGLRALFQDHITQQLQAQLVMQLDHLSGAVDWGPDARVRLAPMAGDARLNRPLSGLYWQIDRLGPQPQAALARSRSLWDQTLALPLTEDATQGDQVLALRGAQGHELLAVARTLQLPDDDAPPLRLAVAADKTLVAEPLQRFTRMLLLALGMLALGLALAVAVQLQLALRPLQQLRARLAAVRGGQTARLEGRFPQELQPLVNEFNHVLAENADMVQRARTQAGNLAHAVHTPLSILANAAAQDGAFRGEEQDLYELLGNLIDNAGKWARARVVVDVQREGGQLCFTVDDDGPGIPPAQRGRMFERGVQLDEQRPGAGLGLDIVRALAETYGGSVQALPSPLGGARLRLCLPAAEGA